MIKEDLEKIKKEFDKDDCKAFLRYLNENYVPEGKKVELTDDMLTEDKIKRTMTVKFSRIFHPDKQTNEKRQIQLLRAQIMTHSNEFIEQYKG